MEPKELKGTLDELMEEISKDPHVRLANLDPSKMVIAIDYGTLEYAVLIHYMNSGKDIIVNSIEYSGKNLLLDTYAVDNIVRGRPEHNFDFTLRNSDFKVVDGEHDKRGDYRFDYSRNHHPRSPRKRK